MSRFARHWHWPIQKRVEQRPCVTREIETWLWIVGSVTIEWVTTEADDQSSLYCVVVSTGAMPWRDGISLLVASSLIWSQYPPSKPNQRTSEKYQNTKLASNICRIPVESHTHTHTHTHTRQQHCQTSTEVDTARLQRKTAIQEDPKERRGERNVRASFRYIWRKMEMEAQDRAHEDKSSVAYTPLGITRHQ